MHRQLRGMHEAAGGDDVAARVAARPTVRGQLPEDPAERAAMARLIDHQLARMRGRRHTASLVAQLVLLAMGVYLAIVRSPGWWVAVVVGAVFLVGSVLIPGRLERRAELLRGGASGA